MSTFVFEGRPIEAEDGETVLAALLRSDVEIGHRCKAGACQSCLLRSPDPVPNGAQAGIDDVLVAHGAFLSCQAKAKDILTAERLGDDALPRHQAVLTSLEWAAEDILILDLQLEDWKAAPGKFIRLHHPSGVARPYSLATPAWIGEGIARLHVRVLPGGEMSGRLAVARAGDPFEIEGPFGRCCYKSETGEEPMLLIGSGTGLAPLYAIATDAIEKGHRGPIDLYHGGATSSRLYYRAELAALAARHPAFRYVPCADEAVGIDRQGSPLQNALTDHPNLEGFNVYLCGHPALVRHAQKKCFLAGASLKDIAADPFEAS